MAEKKVKESCLERMKRIDGERKIADFIVKQKQDYAFKRRYAQIRAQEFARECEARGLNYHVSVGGLDSITLFLFLRSMEKGTVELQKFDKHGNLWAAKVKVTLKEYPKR